MHLQCGKYCNTHYGDDASNRCVFWGRDQYIDPWRWYIPVTICATASLEHMTRRLREYESLGTNIPAHTWGWKDSGDMFLSKDWNTWAYWQLQYWIGWYVILGSNVCIMWEKKICRAYFLNSGALTRRVDVCCLVMWCVVGVLVLPE